MVSTTTKGSNMTNKEKAKLKERMNKLDYWCKLSMSMLIDNKGISQKKALIELRERGDSLNK